MIVDSHAHIFPHLSGSNGFATVADHLKLFQQTIATHSEPVYRLRDHKEVPEAIAGIYAEPFQALDDMPTDGNFRIGPFGRFEWEWQSETYYRSFMPPCLQEMVAPPEYLLQEMARAGVDMAVLQNAGIYGRLNAEFSQAIQDFPGKFIGLADVWPTEADGQTEIDRLVYAVTELGLRGIYYSNTELAVDGHQYRFDDPRYDPYWETVDSLHIPVFWAILGVPMPHMDAYLSEIDRLASWSERFPKIPGLLTHGFSPDLLSSAIPAPVERLLGLDQMSIELLYPIYWGRLHQYPYPELKPALDVLLRKAGPERLIWGSDMPNVLRNCTYKQSLEYLADCLVNSTTSQELDGILGGNAMRLVDNLA